jgi:hypothetical protein
MLIVPSSCDLSDLSASALFNLYKPADSLLRLINAEARRTQMLIIHSSCDLSDLSASALFNLYISADSLLRLVN